MMMKSIVFLALVISAAQGNSVLDALKRLLEEKELEERGVYMVSKTSTSISGTVQVDINDCPKPEDQCLYVITATNINGNDAQSQSVRTSNSPAKFTFDNLQPDGVYELTACTQVPAQNGAEAKYSCGPKAARCDMKDRSNRCSYSMVKKELETRGVMSLVADSSSITGKVQVDIKDCPKPYDCDYTVVCKNMQTGDSKEVAVNTKNSATKPFTCDNLSSGTYQVSACKQDNNQCGPRVGTCDLSSGKCSLKMASSVKKSIDNNSIIDKITELLEEMRE